MSPLLVVVGETASGKSALAMHLARQFNGELICADSWTIRRGLNIGTAKASIEEQAAVAHHLIDVVDPDEAFTAAVFKGLALKAIADITARGKTPILAGGSGLYVDGVIYDYNFLPEGEPGLRDELNALTIEQLVKRIDTLGLERTGVDVGNKRRLIRLIETNGAVQTQAQLRPCTVVIGLQPERAELVQRITQRVDTMLEVGLEHEVLILQQKYGWDCEGLKGIGYREWQDYFAGRQSLEITRQRIISSTINLAKRQRTWFNRKKSIQWFSTPVNCAQIDDFITTQLNK